jgi:hypothetical protein
MSSRTRFVNNFLFLTLAGMKFKLPEIGYNYCNIVLLKLSNHNKWIVDIFSVAVEGKIFRCFKSRNGLWVLMAYIRVVINRFVGGINKGKSTGRLPESEEAVEG